MKKTILSFLLISIIGTTKINAQIGASITPAEIMKIPTSTLVTDNSFWLHASGFFFGAYRLEYERALKSNKMNGIGIMPIYYSFDYGYNTKGNSGIDNFLMSGGGVDISFRKYLKLNEDSRRLGYVKAGLGYSHINYQFKEYGWIDYVGNDGLTYTKYSLNDYTQKTNRFDSFMYFGMRADLNIGFYLDGYFGIVSKASSVKSEFTEKVDTNIDDMGQSYNGVFPRMGLALGFYF